MATAATTLQTNVPATKPSFTSSAGRKAVLSLGLVLVTLLVYNPAVHNGFVGFDDPSYVTENPHVCSGLNWKTLTWALRSTEHANWHPLTWLSHALDCRFFGLNPAGHHGMNVLLHAIVALLLFLALDHMTGSGLRSFGVAVLFALHPMNVQTVAWISERKNILATLFFVLALMAYDWYVQRPGTRRYFVLMLCFVLALLSKPMVVTLPFVLLLLDYWPLKRTSTGLKALLRLLLEKSTLLALAVASAGITFIAQRLGGAIRSDHPFSVRLMNAVICYPRYLGKAIWPSSLAAFYPYPEHAPSPAKLALAGLLLLSVTAFVLLARDKPYLVVGWFWFLGTLVPVMGFIQAGEQVMADRYAYIPFIGLFVATLWGIGDWATARSIPKTALAIVAFAVVLAFATEDGYEISHWRDTVSLWSHTLAVTQANYVAHDSLATELIEQGRIEEAVPHLQAASAINPRDPFSELNLGVCEKRLGDFPSAVRHYQRALALSNDTSLRAKALSNLGAIFRIQRDYARARQSYQSALELQPDNLFALIGMGVLSQKAGDLVLALAYYSRAASVEPSDSEYLLVAQALAKLGRDSEAKTAYLEAEKLSRNWIACQSAVNQLLRD